MNSLPIPALKILQRPVELALLNTILICEPDIVKLPFTIKPVAANFRHEKFPTGEPIPLRPRKRTEFTTSEKRMPNKHNYRISK
jgi:hypothetical protein